MINRFDRKKGMGSLRVFVRCGWNGMGGEGRVRDTHRLFGGEGRGQRECSRGFGSGIGQNIFRGVIYVILAGHSMNELLSYREMADEFCFISKMMVSCKVIQVPILPSLGRPRSGKVGGAERFSVLSPRPSHPIGGMSWHVRIPCRAECPGDSLSHRLPPGA